MFNVNMLPSGTTNLADNTHMGQCTVRLMGESLYLGELTCRQKDG